MSNEALEDTAEFPAAKEELDFDLEQPNNNKAEKEEKLPWQGACLQALRKFFSTDR